MYQEKQKKKVKEALSMQESFTLREFCRLYTDRERGQEDCGTHSVHGGTAIMTLVCFWDFQPRSRWSWGDLDYSSVFGP
jgi:hypothetical protein